MNTPIPQEEPRQSYRAHRVRPQGKERQVDCHEGETKCGKHGRQTSLADQPTRNERTCSNSEGERYKEKACF